MDPDQTPKTASDPGETHSLETISRHAVLFIFVTVFLDMVGVGLILPVVPALLIEVGDIDLAHATIIGGWLFAVVALAQFIFGPIMGNLSDAFGRRPLLLLAIGGLAADYVFSALAPTLFLIFVGRLIAGICGASYVIAMAFLTDITRPDDRARVFGLVGAAFGLGFVVGPAIGGLLGEFGSRVPFWAAAAISGANFVLGYFVLPETLPKSKRRPFEWRRANPLGTLRVFRGYPGIMPLTSVAVVYFTASAVYPAIWAFWSIARFGWSEATIGATLAAFGLLTALTQGLLAGPAVKRLGEDRVIIIGLIIAALAAFGYSIAWSLPMVLILLVFHAPEGLVHPCLTAEMSKQVPEDAQGELQGGLSALQNLAMLIGTVLFTQLFGWFNRPELEAQNTGIGFVVAGVLLSLTFVMYMMMRPRSA